MRELFLSLVNMSIAASWIVLVVAVLRPLLRRSPKWLHCLLWSAVGLRLVMPFRLESVFSLAPQVDVRELPYPGGGGIDLQPPPVTGSPAAGAPAVIPPTTPPAMPPNIPVPGDAPVPAAGQAPDLVTILAVVWLVGCAVMLAYGALSYLRLHRRVGASLPLREDIFVCDDIPSPFLLGVLRPRIYLPSGIPDQQIPYIVAHERAHRKRMDHLWKPLGFVLLAVYWFDPMLWLAYGLFCRDIELACDEKVIRGMGREDKRAYSLALLSCAAPRRIMMASPLAFGEVGIKKRVRSVLHYKRPAFWVTLAAIAACLVVGVCFLTDPYQAEEMPPDITDGGNAAPVGSVEVGSGGDPSFPSIPAVIAYPELVPEELAASPLYAEALERPSAILYCNYLYDSQPQAVTGRAPVDAFLAALERREAGQLYLYLFYESVSLLGDTNYSVHFIHFLTDGGEVRIEEDSLYDWEGPFDPHSYSAHDVYLSDYGYLVYHIDGTTYPSGHPVINPREVFPSYEELTRLQSAYLGPLDYTAVGYDWDWPGDPPSNWLDLFEGIYSYLTGHLPHEDYGSDFPVEVMTATVNRYFDGVTRQMVIGSNFRATYNAAADTLHYEGGRGGVTDPLRVISWSRDGALLTVYYESYDRETGIPYEPYALTVELTDDRGFRYRSNHPAALPIPEGTVGPPRTAPSVPSGEQLQGLDFSAMGREELIGLLQPVLDRAGYFCEFGLVGELDRLYIEVDHDPSAAIRRPYRIFEDHVFYPYKNFPYQSLEELQRDMLTVFTSDNLEGPLAYIFQNMMDENGKVYIPSDVSGYTQTRRWQLEDMEIVSAEPTRLTLSMPVAAGWGDETWIAPLNFQVLDGYIVMDNSYFSIDPANL